MIHAFLDTTILADLTLKDRDTRNQTALALARCASKEYPEYAIKEFNAGPLSNYRWWHNVLAEENSYERAIGRLQKESRTPRRNKTSTALEAIRRIEQDSPGYQNDHERAQGQRLHLKRVIFSAWMMLPNLARMTHPLDCYNAAGPKVLEGTVMIVLGPTRCKGVECTLARTFHTQQGELELLETAMELQPDKQENRRRLSSLKRLRALDGLDDRQCRSLGDAVFALLAPPGFVILTTNIGDHGPLAQALGKRAMLPADV